MGIFWKLAGSFSLKWEFAEMGLLPKSSPPFGKNGIPLYRETPVMPVSFLDGRNCHNGNWKFLCNKIIDDNFKTFFVEIQPLMG